jgi:hypothetical protein
MEHQNVTAMATIDLSTTFDTVDHEILIDSLDQRFGITGNALQWISSYLTPRFFQVIVNNKASEPYQLSH